MAVLRGPIMATGRNPTVCPELYDGSTPISDFFCHFDMVSIVNNWDDRQKAAY